MVSAAGFSPITGLLYIAAALYRPFTFDPHVAGRRSRRTVGYYRAVFRTNFYHNLRMTNCGDCHKEGNHEGDLISVLFHVL
jgi:hypothetical protein